ncbi:hypothetical protein A2130_03285 [Candidatus Woesebacteria bacterium GWC2_33_12]|uniref:Uncharacterized protein n=1 Tax=Candidatus Woesebacteria bacterium GW2011_GWB1_33_22 TaxID=1618566 RepID=A0A0F9ZJS4_9BACT|nr:MAG: hypothetical protein UR29_C0004G0022 [Candidatus Woesebacteria bacterium GW2011_GWC2_33_12]KKP41904.1 MAG: hypothetical protein UR33_C0008G0023 [Candidatus Woesebacteria bacterium GW2011_GWA2_33_20]KKP44478.1 MAG: hypothetical protein UR35_C0008G0023 [Candidatus Woesebacteria bacterium GW2011_GWB1_33_22]KKP46328.1 MAG: hypothetical protein UR37_C0009G0023 [Microgenomates group bacterium GW2011_GWC1_33_28]KKP50425.1 MAG: hypothetical protein UR41_C0008G0023 [Candidatus Woesebacteria bact
MKWLFIVFSFLYLVPVCYAQERIESSNYRIQFPNLNSGAGIPSSSNYKLDSTVGQGVAGKFTSAGYIAKAGFQYIHSIIPFSFSIDDLQINFGTLTPNSPSTDTSTLTVSAGGAGGYSVKVSENFPLNTSDGGDTIIDTLCDTTCSETSATVWSSASKYGFGFNMSGDDIPADFTDATYFRQFADRSSAETEKTIMTSGNVGTSRTATISYKINVSSVQPAGVYRNVLTFTAIPSY